MTKNSRAPAADVIDVFVSIDVPNFRTGRALNEKRFAADIAQRAHWRVNAAGNARLGAGEQLRRTASHAPKIITNSLSAKSQAGREWSRREPSDMDEAPKG